MPEETTTPDTKEAAPKAKKEKPPALEEKPFAEFIEQHYLPTLTTALTNNGVSDLYLSLVEQPLPVSGSPEKCWQIVGIWNKGQRQFNLYFPEGSINGLKAFSYTHNGGKSSALESFLIDERRVTLDLLVFGLIQRLNAQKWLARN
ncbi:MAG: DUF2996 domain-containing protein [Coleofasciculaceae cyanobacterium SM2_1_6]|nr:DUF2996 domain-containing protein [Coleofasciculaceae cyanobacterium SM2_1_6]